MQAIGKAAERDIVLNGLLLKIAGIVFLGTSHGNPRRARYSMIALKIGSLLGHKGARLLRSLAGGDGTPDHLLSWFYEVANDFAIVSFCFFEP